MEPNKEVRPAPLDLGKIPWEDYAEVFRRIKRGTAPGTFIKIISSVVVGIGVILGGVWKLGTVSEEHKIADVRKLELPQESANLPTTSPKTETSEVVPQLQNLKKRNEELEDEVKDLRAKVSRKPSYSTCAGYENETTALQKRKDQIELAIQQRLNPSLSKEQIAQGMSYSVEQISAMTLQAAEYRKMSDDIQRQIIGMLEVRKPCE